MSLEEVQVSSLIPASPNAIYAAWMDSRRHSAITGSVAVINPWVGGRVTARARFIEATHVKLETGKRILLAWRTQDFPADAPDSQVDVLLQPAAGGTKVSIQHSQIPAGHAAAAREIWRSLYLDPMKRYFGKTGAMEAAHRAAARAGQMPTADMVGMRHARTPITSTGNVTAPVISGLGSGSSDEGRTKPRRIILRKKKDGIALGGTSSASSDRPPRLTPLPERPKIPTIKSPNLKPLELVAKPGAAVKAAPSPAKAAHPTAKPTVAKSAPATQAAKASVAAKPDAAKKPTKKPAQEPTKKAPAKPAKPVKAPVAKKAAPKAKPAPNPAPKPTTKAKPIKAAAPPKAGPKKPARKPAAKAKPAPKKPARKPAAKAKPAPKKPAPKPTTKANPIKAAAPKKAAPKKTAKPAPKKPAAKTAPKARPSKAAPPKKAAPKKGRG